MAPRNFFSPVSQVEIEEMNDSTFDIIIEIQRNVMAEFNTSLRTSFWRLTRVYMNGSVGVFSLLLVCFCLQIDSD